MMGATAFTLFLLASGTISPSPCESAGKSAREMLDREARLSYDVDERRPTVAQLQELACLRWKLWQQEAIARPGPNLPLGETWLDGGRGALERWLLIADDPTPAIELLAEMVAAEPRRLALRSLWDATARVRASRFATHPAFLEACARLGVSLGEDLDAGACARARIASPPSPPMVALLLARIAARASDTTAAGNWFDHALRDAATADDWDHLQWHLRWFASPEEFDSLQTLEGAQKLAAMREMLARRDLELALPLGTRVLAHFERLDHVERHFRLEGVRGHDWRLMEGPSTGLEMPPGTIGAPGELYRQVPRWQAEFDDRGTIWLRHGQPSQRIRASVGAELWHYEDRVQPLWFEFAAEPFTGSVEATRLVLGRAGPHWCDVSQYRCYLADAMMQAESKQAILLELVEEDRDIVDIALATDDIGANANDRIRPLVRGHQLWDLQTGAPIVLLAYALRLPADQDASEDGHFVRLRVRSFDAQQGATRDTSVMRLHRQAIASGDTMPRHAVGLLLLPEPSRHLVWGAHFDWGEGTASASGSARVPPPEQRVAMSDLVLGHATGGMSWQHRGRTVSVNPLQANPLDAPVPLYYQVRTTAALDGARTTIAVHRMERGRPEPKAALSVTFDSPLLRGTNEATPTVDASQLSPGAYQLRVIVQDADRAVVAQREAPLNLYGDGKR